MMETFKKLLPWGLVVILLFILMHRYDELVSVKIPSNTGVFEKYDLEPIKEVEPEKKVLQKLEKLTTKQKDSAYLKDTSTRVYQETFKDSVQEIKVTGIAQGYIESIKLEYITEPFKMDVKVRRRINMYVGAEVNPIDPFRSVNAKAYIVTKKVIYSYGYDINRDTHLVGAAIKIF